MEKFGTRITLRHLEACRVVQSSDLNKLCVFFLSARHSHDRYFLANFLVYNVWQESSQTLKNGSLRSAPF